jgi:hypothetical protein
MIVAFSLDGYKLVQQPTTWINYTSEALLKLWITPCE